MPRHILIVEDEEHLAIGLKYNLEAEGYRTSLARNGLEALARLDDPKNQLDLIILDIMMPGMSGYDVCRAVRSRGLELPVLMLSARSLAEDRSRGFDVGTDQYLSKPFELDELLSRVRNLLLRFPGPRRQATAANGSSESEVYVIGDAAVNFASFEVTREDRTQRLTPLEVKLLRHFIRNEGRVIPRFELLEDVWEMAGDATSRAPDQFILRLRRIFEPDPSQPRYFVTIRDGGYRFVAKPERSDE